MNPDLEKAKILYTVQDVAQMMGMSDSAIRMHLFRKSGFLPAPIRVGTKKLIWTREQLETHFRSLTPYSPNPAPKKIGRPSKRVQLARQQVPSE
jgi:predicted DNA-binding transcriptional regulator AlpA